MNKLKKRIIQSDCIDEMRKFSENSVDAIITDPPYGLKFMGKEWDKFALGLQQFCQSWATECLRVLKPGGFLLSFGGTRTYHRMVCGIEDAGFEIRDCIMWVYGSGFPKSLNIGKQIDKIKGVKRKVIGKSKAGFLEKNNVFELNNKGYGNYDVTVPATPEAKEWDGWGTALKPALEPIVVARKPLSKKNVALNVLKWGTGGINIGACRIGNEKRFNQPAKSIYSENKEKIINDYKGQKVQGRFPANIILDEKAGKMLGTPSRFFYCAKVSRSERNFGCEELEERKLDESRKEGNPGGDNPRNRGVNPQRNNHPTLKPIKLMEYLVKLVSREGAIILDPFLGSGTTAIACLKLNRKFIGIEKEPEYCKIAEARVSLYLNKKSSREKRKHGHTHNT